MAWVSVYKHWHLIVRPRICSVWICFDAIVYFDIHSLVYFLMVELVEECVQYVCVAGLDMVDVPVRESNRKFMHVC